MGNSQKLFYSSILPPPQKLRWAGFFLILPLVLQLSCSSPTEPNDNLHPGRRDYVWTADTLWSNDWLGITSVWGSSPNSIWATAASTTANDRLWYYNGLNWERQSFIGTGTLYTVFGVNSGEIWMGDDESNIWRNTGTGWQKFKYFTINGFDFIIITSIHGSSANNLYAVGFADTYDGSKYKGIIVKYNGTEWKLLNILDLRIGFLKIRQMKNGKYLISGNSDNTYKLFIFDGIGTLKEIHSDFYPGLYEMNGEAYITINRKIYKYKNEKLELWKEFPGTNYIGTVYGRSEKDFFGSGSNGEIMHYNGTDLKILYHTPFYGALGGLIFEQDVFFNGYDSEKQLNVMIRGTLKEE